LQVSNKENPRHLASGLSDSTKKELFSLLRSQLSLNFAALRKENAGALRATLVRNRVIVSCERYLVSKVLIEVI
jgi:hypothetical protein